MMDAIATLTSANQEKKQKIASVTIGILFVIFIPSIHLGIIQRLWTPYKRAVDREECSCSCWDTIFKGSYQEYVSGFLHIYINVTSNTLLIWIITVLAVIAGYESLRYVTQLGFKGHLRTSLLILFLLDLYPHYYSWWGYLNAVNDEFYEQWLHQLFFSVTELVSTGFVLYSCDTTRDIQPRHLVIIGGIALLHIVSSATDQFIKNVMLQKGHGFQVARDVAFMSADLIHVFIPLRLLMTSSKRPAFRQILSYNDYYIGIGVIFIWFLSMFI